MHFEPEKALILRELFNNTYEGKKVFVTGHTGFVGSWLCLWLLELGADVTGYSLEPPSEPNLFTVSGLKDRIHHIHGDVRDLPGLQKAMAGCGPDMVFHLAAQALVRPGYDEPVDTFATNLMGTVNVLEAVRHVPSVKVCQIITTDKCYENREKGVPFSEDDPLGGQDPYSASKACAEIAAFSYRRSFGNEGGSPRGMATVRAGNIIGGGDWGEDRLLPDCIRALSSGQDIVIRSPNAVRPWQFIAEPLSGYLHLGAMMSADPSGYNGAWNFGPVVTESMPVSRVVDMVAAGWGVDGWQSAGKTDAKHEAAVLRLDTSKAREKLGWTPLYDTGTAVSKTLTWYRAFYRGDEDMAALIIGQLSDYAEKAAGSDMPWAGGSRP
jgi:CDP-glucose 4,6-dehydratase